MRIITISDLHLEGQNMDLKQFDNDLAEADTLILAGDIITAKSLRTNPGKNLEGLLEIAHSRINNIIAVQGNHESYGTSNQKAVSDLEEFYDENNVWFLRDSFLELGGVNFFGGCLGSNFGHDALSFMAAANSINDYRLITNEKSRRWTPRDTKRQYEDFVNNFNFFDKLHGIDVVISHFSPSMSSCHYKWGESPLNKYFHNNMNDFINGRNVKLWVHGHTHDPSHYYIGSTEIYCNPRGYYHENNQLKLGEVINVD